MEWSGMEWNGVECMEWNGKGMEWNRGMESSSGMEWNGMEWNGGMDG